MIFRFSKDFQDISFSFSPEMENEKRKKLIEITGIYNPIINSKYKAQLKGRKLSYQIERISVENQQEKMMYFKRFEKSLKN